MDIEQHIVFCELSGKSTKAMLLRSQLTAKKIKASPAYTYAKLKEPAK